MKMSVRVSLSVDEGASVVLNVLPPPPHPLPAVVDQQCAAGPARIVDKCGTDQWSVHENVHIKGNTSPTLFRG